MTNQRRASISAGLALLMTATLFGQVSDSSPTAPSATAPAVAAQSASMVPVKGNGVQSELSGASFSGYCAYRFNGSHVIINCNDYRINPNSRVFLSISEYSTLPWANRFIGAARMTIHNVSPHQGGVSAWVDVEWGYPLNVRVDVLVDP